MFTESPVISEVNPAVDIILRTTAGNLIVVHYIDSIISLNFEKCFIESYLYNNKSNRTSANASND